MLERHGHEVHTFECHSDEIRKKGLLGLVIGAISTPWNHSAARKMRTAIAKFGPDVVHAHNTFPMLSPSIFPAAQGVARVLTLHNYRLVCPAAIPMRGGEICTLCMDRKSVLSSIRYGCYRGSVLATLPLAVNVALHRRRGTWKHDVETFIALTGFQRDRMGKAGIPADKIRVKPNFYPGNPSPVPFGERPARVVFAGRLSAEKGVTDLVEAWLSWGPTAPELRLLGDGPLREELESRASDVSNIRVLGQLSSDDAQNE
ncbi:MAG: hypothetical protein CMJ86_05770, partial [Planctomycetes bacterium]|nr:hypothetical protein [Planctomycetota bacterium]